MAYWDLSNNKRKKIGTHSGKFHCDEALACFMLKSLERYSDAQIIRTRDLLVLDRCDIVVDVGGVYDHKKLRYDHHQAGFEETFGFDFSIKLSSAGLIYKHYGREILLNFINSLNPKKFDIKTLTKNTVIDKLWIKIYESFIAEIDAVDNGINQYSDSGEPIYRISTSLSSRVSFIMPQQNDEESENFDTLFIKAVELTGKEFMYRLNYCVKNWFPAFEIVDRCITNRYEVDTSGSVFKLEPFCPQKSHVFDCEKENNISEDNQLLYVLYKGGDQWRIQCIPKSLGSFESRKPLPKPQRGLRSTELSKVSGIEDIGFVHASGFIGGADSYEGVLKMARYALAV